MCQGPTCQQTGACASGVVRPAGFCWPSLNDRLAQVHKGGYIYIYAVGVGVQFSRP
jgi:hypothetical protein